MNTQLPRLAAGLIACAVSTWAAADLPTYETYSAAADVGATNFFTVDPTYTQLLDVTATPGATAQINGSGYTASANTTLSSNHASVSASTTPTNILSVDSFSGWYDQVTITGGYGTGTASFSVRLNGTVDVGAAVGSLAYALGTSSVHPSQLTSNLIYFNTIQSNPQPWPMDAVTPITSYLLGASPYNDTSIYFGQPIISSPPDLGIPALIDPINSLGGDLGMGFPTYDLVLTPGTDQNINITLTGTLTFTYGEAFYLIGGLNASVLGGGIESFCSFNISNDPCSLPKDGTGATTLDFSNSANLVNIALPQGATASFASGETYNVTSVPEPAEYLMLLAGLGLVGWRARRRS